jgi:hypothetical protein
VLPVAGIAAARLPFRQLVVDDPSGRRTTPNQPGTTCSSRRARQRWRPGRRCRTPAGHSCAAGRVTLHPHLANYQTWDGVDNCTATGTTGAWNAASGNSAGWQQWSIDLSAYAGENVEISIGYASDWSAQGVGVFVDDITLPDGTFTSFETGQDGWAIAGPPDGSAPNVNNFIRTDATGFPVGNAITTPQSLLLGFGLEAVSTDAERNQVMGRVLALAGLIPRRVSTCD